MDNTDGQFKIVITCLKISCQVNLLIGSFPSAERDNSFLLLRLLPPPPPLVHAFNTIKIGSEGLPSLLLTALALDPKNSNVRNSQGPPHHSTGHYRLLLP